MRDFVTEERISAYVDGELAGDELQLVESLLAESAEYRQFLAELQSLRASMQRAPRFSLPPDFQSRVLDQVSVSPTKGPVEPPSRRLKALPWRRALLAAASLAAVIAVTVMLRPPSSTPTIGGVTNIGTTPVAMPVYLQQQPNYVLVYDVTVTSAGQKSKAVETLLKRLGIGIDPALRLDGSLEQSLMTIRASDQIPGATETLRYKDDVATPKSTANDSVEMIYIAGLLMPLDQLGVELERMSQVGKEVSELHYDMVSEPNKLGVMHRLHDSVREHFAANPDAIPSDVGQAFRLAFHVKLTSLSVPGSATFPIPTFHTNEFDAKNAAVAGGYVLLIIRNVGANADEAN